LFELKEFDSVIKANSLVFTDWSRIGQALDVLNYKENRTRHIHCYNIDIMSIYSNWEERRLIASIDKKIKKALSLGREVYFVGLLHDNDQFDFLSAHGITYRC